jgi:malonyl-CoA O-methyltransferase
MSMNKELVRKHFNRHAHEYDQFANVQIHMADRLFTLLEANKSPMAARILEIGSGTGLLTRKLRSLYPEAELIVNDLSESMLETLRIKLGTDTERMEFVLGDAEGAEVIAQLSEKAARAGKFDMIISSATFQWFNQPAATIDQYLRLLNKGGTFAFATFGPQTFYELRASFQAAELELKLPHTKHGQSFSSAEEWLSFFPKQSGTSFEWHDELRVEHFPTVGAFLNAVKRVGASNANASSTSGQQTHFAGKSMFRAMEQWYWQHYADERGIHATYELGFAIFNSKEKT